MSATTKRTFVQRVLMFAAAGLVAGNFCMNPSNSSQARADGGLSNLLPPASGGTGSTSAAADPFEGIFAANGVGIEIHRDGDHYRGTISRGSQQFPFTAQATGDKLRGTFTSDGADFPFTCQLAGAQMIFSTGGTSLALQAVNAQPPAQAAAGAAPAAPATAPQAAPRLAAKYIYFTSDKVHDKIAQCDAGTMLVPQGWQNNITVLWRPDPFYPAVLRGAVFNPNGPEAVSVYPVMDFCCSAGMPGGMANLGTYLDQRGEGNRYIGMEIHHLLTTPKQFLQEIIIPRFRPELANATIVSDDDHPELAQVEMQRIGPAPGLKCKVSRIRLAYSIKGTELEEDFYVTIEGFAGPSNTIDWGGTAQSYRAAKGNVDANMGVFRTIVDSMRPTVEWFNLVQQGKSVMRQLIEHETDLAVQLSNYLTHCNHQISRSIQEAYEHRQAVQDQCAEKYDQTIRGVETYNNPYGGKMEVPAGYSHVYMNPTGGVIVSDDPSFNINKVPGTWQEAHR